jgi:hypothetical protein
MMCSWYGEESKSVIWNKTEYHVRPGHAVGQWLRHYATNWKVTGLIPDEVNF